MRETVTASHSSIDWPRMHLGILLWAGMLRIVLGVPGMLRIVCWDWTCDLSPCMSVALSFFSDFLFENSLSQHLSLVLALSLYPVLALVRIQVSLSDLRSLAQYLYLWYRFTICIGVLVFGKSGSEILAPMTRTSVLHAQIACNGYLPLPTLASTHVTLGFLYNSAFEALSDTREELRNRWLLTTDSGLDAFITSISIGEARIGSHLSSFLTYYWLSSECCNQWHHGSGYGLLMTLAMVFFTFCSPL